MTDKPRVPANAVESAINYDLMRVLLVHVLLHRKTPITVTRRQHEDPDLPRVMLRTTVDKDLTLRAWLEEPEGHMRRGVGYVPDSD